jgi:hypothetical protein
MAEAVLWFMWARKRFSGFIGSFTYRFAGPKLPLANITKLPSGREGKYDGCQFWG